MKILHTADWHLGKKLEGFSRFEEQVNVLEEIIQLAEKESVDLVLVAGDLFDTFNPPVEAVELLYRSLKRLTRNGTCPVVAIAGNHDSPERIEAPDSLAKECGIFLLGFPYTAIKPFSTENGISIVKSDDGFIELNTPSLKHPIRLLLTPYANEVRLKKFLGVEDKEAELRNVLEDHWGRLAEKHMDNKGVNLLMAHLYV